jgi:hypothetical protein
MDGDGWFLAGMGAFFLACGIALAVEKNQSPEQICVNAAKTHDERVQCMRCK